MVTVLMLVLLFALDGDGEVAVVIDAYSAIFLLDARGCKLHRVGFLTLLDPIKVVIDALKSLYLHKVLRIIRI